jgi:2'-5' RNA ligase
LKRKDTFHITLCFFQKKCEDKGAIVEEFKRFIEEHGKEVSITVTGIGYLEGTCALQVSPVILTMDGRNITVPWIHEKQNHITIALEEGKSAKNSVLAVMKQEESGDYPGDFISFEPGIIINGNLKPFSS